MSAIIIRVDTSSFDKMLVQVSRMQSGVQRAVAQGLNEGGDKVRTQVQRALWQQTGLKSYSSVTSRVRTARAYEGSLTYQIIARGKGIPIREFPLTVKTGVGGFVDAKTWGVDHLFKRSFVMVGGGTNPYRARLGPERFPIRGLYGPSLPKELGKGVVPSVFVFSTNAFVNEAITKRLARVM